MFVHVTFLCEWPSPFADIVIHHNSFVFMSPLIFVLVTYPLWGPHVCLYKATVPECRGSQFLPISRVSDSLKFIRKLHITQHYNWVGCYNCRELIRWKRDIKPGSKRWRGSSLNCWLWWLLCRSNKPGKNSCPRFTRLTWRRWPVFSRNRLRGSRILLGSRKTSGAIYGDTG